MLLYSLNSFALPCCVCALSEIGLVSQGEDVFPIPGTKRIKYLEQNAAAFHIKLTAEEKLQLEAVFASDQVGSVGHICFTCLTCLQQTTACRFVEPLQMAN